MKGMSIEEFRALTRAHKLGLPDPTPKPKRKQRQITTDEAAIPLALRCRQDCEEGARLHAELVRATTAMCGHIEQHRRENR